MYRTLSSRFGGLLVAVLVNLLFSPAAAQEVGSFFAGGNYALTETFLDNNFTTHEVNPEGVSLGFILPITRNRFGISYKGAVAFHGVTDILYSSSPSPDDKHFYRNLDQYIGSLNEVTVGTRIDLSRRSYIQPMLGVGVLVHIIYGNEGAGIAYGNFQTDLTSLIMYELKSFDIGAIASFAYVPLDGYLNRGDLKYLAFGAVISK